MTKVIVDTDALDALLAAADEHVKLRALAHKVRSSVKRMTGGSTVSMKVRDIFKETVASPADGTYRVTDAPFADAHRIKDTPSTTEG